MAANDNDKDMSLKDTSYHDTDYSDQMIEPIPVHKTTQQAINQIIQRLARSAAQEWFESLKSANDNAEPSDNIEDARIEDIGVSAPDISSNPANDVVSSPNDECHNLMKTLDDVHLSDNALGDCIHDSCSDVFGSSDNFGSSRLHSNQFHSPLIDTIGEF